ncbi:MAG: DUF1851 domain-containing protein [Phaeodactylibacter sp.]|nr:DUF1851 domain-containing protein [Phaeodactylibacter sp.]
MSVYPNFINTYGEGKEWLIRDDLANSLIEELPSDLKGFFSDFGSRSYIGGFLSVFPPKYLLVELTSWLGLKDGIFPFAHTGLGDIYFMDKNYVRILYINSGVTDIAASSSKRFFEKLITDKSYVEKIMKKPYFDFAKGEFGDLGFMQAYCYEPALVLGGTEKPENLRKVSLREHMLFLSQVIGEVRYKSY